ncbi:MAG: imidazole glycerol phosphate synthase subunit HisH [Vicinamibacterales bacterium]
MSSKRVAIVDYGLVNLFSVQAACGAAGMEGFVTSDRAAIAAADAVVLPGMGAFGDAMDALRRLDLVAPILDVAAAGTPLFGVCLGLQLLMTESFEFGRHRGLGLIEGTVEPLREGVEDGRRLKVPHIGWNQLQPPGDVAAWAGSPLGALPAGAYMYFVHSFYVTPVDPACVLSVTRYGETRFCSSLRSGNIFACQFHPERSGPAGLSLYRWLSSALGAAGDES